jgi:hypothetical protein
VSDNQEVSPSATYDVATDKVTYSGDADQDVQLTRPVHVAGAEGSRTVDAITTADGLKVVDGGGSLTVDGPLTDTQLRNSAVPVSGPLTDTQLRATAVPVSGTVTANAGTGTFATGLDTPVGATNETAASTDTATAGLNGRLQRIAQRLSSLIALLPGALGAGGGLKVDGSGTALPVSGTVTAVSATATNLKVDASGVAVPVTDNSGSLTVDYATTGSGTATGALRVELPTNGTGVIAAVTAISNALPAGTNAIGKLAANSGVDIGDVDVTSLPADPLGANADAIVAAGATGSISAKMRRLTQGVEDLKTGITALPSHAVTLGNSTSGPQKAEDAVAADGDVGIPAMVVRKATPANTSGTDGDYEFPQASGGRVWTINTENTDHINVAGVATAPKFAKIVASSSGVTEVIALVSGKKIRVLSLSLTANAAVNVKFQSHTTPTDLTGLYYLGDKGGFVLPYNPLGHFESLSGQALDINLSGAVAVGGQLVYVEVG